MTDAERRLLLMVSGLVAGTIKDWPSVKMLEVGLASEISGSAAARVILSQMVRVELESPGHPGCDVAVHVQVGTGLVAFAGPGDA